MRLPISNREKSAYIILRKKGPRRSELSINQIAKLFGRSTSTVYKFIKVASKNDPSLNTKKPQHTLSVYHQLLLGRERLDLRKLPNQTRLRASKRVWTTMNRYRADWEAFILGIGEKPP